MTIQGVGQPIQGLTRHQLHYLHLKLLLMASLQRILLVILGSAVGSESCAIHVQQVAGHLPIILQRVKYFSAVAHDGPPIRLVSKRGILLSIRSRWSKKRRKCRWRKRGRVQSAVVGTINARVHEPHRTKLVEIKQHDGRADL